MKHASGRVLIVSPDFPFPPNHGGRADILSRIVTLKENGFDVDLIATVKHYPSDSDMSSMRLLVNNIVIVPRCLDITSGLSTLPFQLRSRRGLLSVSIPRMAYDTVLLETEYVAPILDNPGLEAETVILRVQNNETRYFKELGNSSNRITKKLFYYSESAKFSIWHSYIQKRVDALFYISSLEFEQSVFKDKSFWVPPSIDIQNMKVHKGIPQTVLFVGSLFMPNNLEGLSWYVNFVHDHLLDIPDYKLIIAGNSRGLTLKQEFNRERVVFYDSPDDLALNNIYDSASVFIAPMFHGAGVKMKVINAIVNGLPVVATNTSNEGNGLLSEKHLLISDQPIEFAYHIRSLLNSPAKREGLVKDAQAFFAEHYDSTNFIKYITDCHVASEN
ncbi:glycosyltransferase family 4 protein [Acidithiobacillus ferridurans]|jgi:glycosyltransferase involved in cell wall biosynthesis|uniref:Glycosyltransferase family 4 protein n=3 Tax=Acidithiobacillus ferridurans TaxID=1232575 RepID=A0A8X8KAE3_ACIFI|nr:glycosyltransferase family 4 protein [Acidithiobacillus ferridurans]MBU2716267.1 glycosyltransferase family 4 protein [Acidithiobacillus ferridurans]MBU2723561.1 glycosyltransferase family 4 protein [Acidithiobacillus ferridurans]BBF65116.1 hypothetical protein AFERRID_13340 [Acidithiobacillus ferridurans]